MDKPSLIYINKLSNGDEAFFKRLINVINIEFPQEKELYYYNINTNKYDIAADSVHKLKHKISILSFETGYQIASQHEDNLRAGNNTLAEEFDRVLILITKFLISL
ncbi:hypothetical protein [Siansivirga zeaxanthinifaciens]|uniref:Histidine kinase n=1 Tax=Siansivirga zeaxanthinifaciens CC-SAMT-1 TaxID=1454006 RepID=A0A0C5WFX2_9FLAO|nr:hypothetical protein [Siansivirga zeaxanthinifaciens]AJR04084.1 histidine kinase [Siansivirga zeaxanthinifaciens CC-SAMT-1]